MRLVLTLLTASLVVAGCEHSGSPSSDGGAGGGDLVVLLESEDSITEGVEAGASAEQIQDGWSVTFEDYVLVIGDIDVHLSSDETVNAEAADTFAVDLVDVPATGLELWRLSGLTPGRWEFNYSIAGAGEATAHESVSAAQLEEMAAGDWTYLIAGTMQREDGQSCPPAAQANPGGATPNGLTNAAGDPCYANPAITFRFGIEAPTAFGPCEVDDMPGFAITAGRTTTVGATIHGDHVFFNGFPEGGEGGVTRLAQWLADCDLNLDGAVTREELEQLAPSDLVEIDARFQLGGSPISPLLDMWDYLTAQVKSQGHFQGEGECPFDGLSHAHP